MNATLFFIAGDVSGDAHAAALISHLRALDSGLHFFGAGGPRMREAGMDLAINLTDHAVLGLIEVLRKYTKFRGFFHDLLREVERRRPEAVVLVDSPGFNLRFAKAIDRHYPRGSGYRPVVIYYICPQVWAWAERRVALIERCVDLMLSIFPFEKDWFAARAPRLRIEFVGHPMVDRFGPREPVVGAQDNPVLALLPGSRRREMLLHWPIMAESARRFCEQQPANIEVVAAADWAESIVRGTGVDFTVSRKTDDTLRRSRVAIVASGTATLECAYFGVPSVVLYKVAWPTYLIGRMLVKVSHLAMPNLMANETVYPEFIQHRAVPSAIATAALDLWRNDPRRRSIRDKLDRVIESLGPPGASQRAAKFILGELEKNRQR